MKYNTLRFLALPILFLFFLLDGQLSTLFTNLSFVTVSISTHLLLLVGLYFIDIIALPSSLLLFALLGIIYDQYYLNVLGIATTIFPLSFLVVYFFYKSFQRNWLFDLLVFLVMVFYFEFASYLFARIFHLTNLSVFIFTFYKLVPSLLINLTLFAVLRPLFLRVFSITYKT